MSDSDEAHTACNVLRHAQTSVGNLWDMLCLHVSCGEVHVNGVCKSFCRSNSIEGLVFTAANVNDSARHCPLMGKFD